MFHNRHIAGEPRQRYWLTAILPVVTTVAPIVTGAIGAPNAQDEARAATAQAWYNRAIAGDVDALNCLKYMSGRFGSGPCGGGTASGFATQFAKDYDYKLYQQALQVLQGLLPQGTPVPTTPAATTPGPIQIQATVGGPSGSGVTVQTPQGTAQIGSGAPLTTQQRTTNTLLWVLAGVVVVGGIAVYLTRKRG